MPNREVPQPNYPLVEVVLNSIADWVTRYRDAVGHTNEFGQCSPDEVRQIAKDLGVPPGELRNIASKGPHAADLVQKMLVALHVDPKALEKSDPVTMRDLQRLCIQCGDKRRCQSELAKGTAADHYHEFCPNALTLDALFKQNEPKARH